MSSNFRRFGNTERNEYVKAKYIKSEDVIGNTVHADTIEPMNGNNNVTIKNGVLVLDYSMNPLDNTHENAAVSKGFVQTLVTELSNNSFTPEEIYDVSLVISNNSLNLELTTNLKTKELNYKYSISGVINDVNTSIDVNFTDDLASHEHQYGFFIFKNQTGENITIKFNDDVFNVNTHDSSNNLIENIFHIVNGKFLALNYAVAGGKIILFEDNTYFNDFYAKSGEIVDATTNNLDITTKLTTSSENYLNNHAMRITHDGSVNYIQTRSNNTDISGDLFFGNWKQNTNSSERKIIFKANGDIGLGIKEPERQLHIRANPSSGFDPNSGIRIDRDKSGPTLQLHLYNSSYNNLIGGFNTGVQSGKAIGTGDASYSYFIGDYKQNTIGGNETMIQIDSNGTIDLSGHVVLNQDTTALNGITFHGPDGDITKRDAGYITGSEELVNGVDTSRYLDLVGYRGDGGVRILTNNTAGSDVMRMKINHGTDETATVDINCKLDMSNNKITNVADPSENTDVVNKQYLDSTC